MFQHWAVSLHALTTLLHLVPFLLHLFIQYVRSGFSFYPFSLCLFTNWLSPTLPSIFLFYFLYIAECSPQTHQQRNHWLWCCTAAGRSQSPQWVWWPLPCRCHCPGSSECRQWPAIFCAKQQFIPCQQDNQYHSRCRHYETWYCLYSWLLFEVKSADQCLIEEGHWN